MVKIHLGAQIDGFAAISAETIVIGATAADPVTGRRADVLKAAWHSAEVAMRLIKAGNKNWVVTEAVNRCSASWDCKPVEGPSIVRNYVQCAKHAIFYCVRHVVLPTNAKCYRREEADYP